MKKRKKWVVLIILIVSTILFFVIFVDFSPGGCIGYRKKIYSEDPMNRYYDYDDKAWKQNYSYKCYGYELPCCGLETDNLKPIIITPSPIK